jgi:hypothetical protein
MDLHSKSNISREVKPTEVRKIRQKMNEHNEFTNEVFNLMGQ